LSVSISYDRHLVLGTLKSQPHGNAQPPHVLMFLSKKTKSAVSSKSTKISAKIALYKGDGASHRQTINLSHSFTVKLECQLQS
jgi:hypothetical protein